MKQIHVCHLILLKKCIHCSLNSNTLNKKNDSLHGYMKKAVTDVGTLKLSVHISLRQQLSSLRVIPRSPADKHKCRILAQMKTVALAHSLGCLHDEWHS